MLLVLCYYPFLDDPAYLDRGYTAREPQQITAYINEGNTLFLDVGEGESTGGGTTGLFGYCVLL